MSSSSELKQSPWQQLIPDILIAIFIECVAPENDFRCDDTTIFKMPLKCGQICSHWRNVALTSSHLWSRIFIPSYYFGYDGMHAEVPPVIELFIARSVKAPLSVGFVTRRSDNWLCASNTRMSPAVQLLMGQAERWKSLKLLGHKCAVSAFLETMKACAAPLLETAEYYELEDHDQALELHGIHPPVFEISWTNGVTSPVMNSLRHLTLAFEYQPAVSKYKGWLYNAPNLEELKMTFQDTLERPTDDQSHPPISLCRLRKLHIISYGDCLDSRNRAHWQLRSFFSGITAPRLEDLDVNIEAGYRTNDVMERSLLSFLHWSSPSLLRKISIYKSYTWCDSRMCISSIRELIGKRYILDDICGRCGGGTEVP